MQQVVILCDGEREQNEHEVLARAADLRIGKAAFSVDDVGTDAAERADVREQCGDEMRAAVDRAVKAPSEKAPADEAREEDDEREERGQNEEIPRERQRPEAEEREQREEYDDIDADEQVDGRVREEATLIEEIADDEWQDQIGEEIDQARIDFVHKIPSLSQSIRMVRSS